MIIGTLTPPTTPTTRINQPNLTFHKSLALKIMRLPKQEVMFLKVILKFRFSMKVILISVLRSTHHSLEELSKIGNYKKKKKKKKTFLMQIMISYYKYLEKFAWAKVKIWKVPLPPLG